MPPSASLADRRATAAAIFTDPRNGRLPRTLVNRIWQRLLGHGIVANPDEMDGEPWSPELLDWLASDFVEHGYDLKHLIATILTSRAYQMPAVRANGEAQARGYVFAGPGDPSPDGRAVRRRHRLDHRRVERVSTARRLRRRQRRGGPPTSDAVDGRRLRPRLARRVERR